MSKKYYILKEGDIIKDGDEFSYTGEFHNHKYDTGFFREDIGVAVGSKWTPRKWSKTRREIKIKKYKKFDSNKKPLWVN